MSGFGLPSDLRIRKRSEFDRVIRTGVLVGDRRLQLWAIRRDGPTRLGLAMSRRHGGAVRRNQLKRMVREAFRLNQHRLPPGLDLVCRPRFDAHLKLPETGQSLLKLAQRAAKLLADLPAAPHEPGDPSEHPPGAPPGAPT